MYNFIILIECHLPTLSRHPFAWRLRPPYGRIISIFSKNGTPIRLGLRTFSPVKAFTNQSTSVAHFLLLFGLLRKSLASIFDMVSQSHNSVLENFKNFLKIYLKMLSCFLDPVHASVQPSGQAQAAKVVHGSARKEQEENVSWAHCPNPQSKAKDVLFSRVQGSQDCLQKVLG